MKLNDVSLKVWKECFKLKKEEKVLILSDVTTKNIARSLVDTANQISKEVVMIEITELERNGQEPLKYVADLMKKFDVIIAPMSKSISHTKARLEATKKGIRMATLPGITEEMYLRAVPADYVKMKDLTEKFQKLLDRTRRVRLTTKLGTDVSFVIKGRRAVSDYGDLSNKKDFDNLPSGEAFIAPIESSMEGIVYFDASFGTGKLTEPVKVEFKKGVAIKFSGKDATKVRGLFKGLPQKAFNVAEFGIGTNDKAQITGKTLEDEKVFGTCHIALGNNINFGGRNKVEIHIDGVITKPTIYFDDKMLILDGKLLVPL